MAVREAVREGVGARVAAGVLSRATMGFFVTQGGVYGLMMVLEGQTGLAGWSGAVSVREEGVTDNPAQARDGGVGSTSIVTEL